MRIPRIIGALAASAAIAASVAACSTGGGNGGGNTYEQRTSKQELTIFEQGQPAPVFKYSVMRQELIDIEAIQALGEQTTSFFMPAFGNGPPQGSCPSIGMPIPNTAQLTNPQQIVNDGYPNGGAAVTLGNIDPNGTYSPSNSSGTYVLCIGASGQQYLQYWEGPVRAVTGAAYWNAKLGAPVIQGAVTMPTCAIKHQQITLNGKTTSVPVNVCRK